MSHYAQQNHQATSQGAPPAPPYPAYPQFGMGRGFHRPVVPMPFPQGPVQATEQSPSPSEESHQGRVESEVRVEPPIPPDQARPPPPIMYNQVDVQRVEGLPRQGPQ